MFVKIINSYRLVVAVCDEELLGKKFEEGIKQLDVKESFYKSEKNYSEEEVFEMIRDLVRDDATFNIVGENSIRVAISAGIISEKEVGRIGGIPFALILL